MSDTMASHIATLVAGVLIGVAGGFAYANALHDLDQARHETKAVVVSAKAETVIAAKSQNTGIAAKEARHAIDSAPPIFMLAKPDPDDGLPVTCTKADPDLVWRRFADTYNKLLDRAGATAAIEPHSVRGAAPQSE